MLPTAEQFVDRDELSNIRTAQPRLQRCERGRRHV
jgi:hypothetical protein